MKDLPLLVIRILAGGAFVAGFAMLGDTLKPKMFAGLFSGAPSVATVSLLVTGIAMGPAKVSMYATGMIAGAVGLVVYSLAAAYLMEHLNALVGSALAWVAWLVPAGIVYAVFLR
ncbi:MAG TPA: DUF3147 family protein [Candidatus Dormibacteraeota bacterium]|nr:DUF3147 family protein [Candidatus Dormibacteraeota bacterium]